MTEALVVFAITGLIPADNNAGRVINVPPPAIEFRPPANNAALHANKRLE